MQGLHLALGGQAQSLDIGFDRRDLGHSRRLLGLNVSFGRQMQSLNILFGGQAQSLDIGFDSLNFSIGLQLLGLDFGLNSQAQGLDVSFGGQAQSLDIGFDRCDVGLGRQAQSLDIGFDSLDIGFDRRDVGLGRQVAVEQVDLFIGQGLGLLFGKAVCRQVLDELMRVKSDGFAHGVLLVWYLALWEILVRAAHPHALPLARLRRLLPGRSFLATANPSNPFCPSFLR